MITVNEALQRSVFKDTTVVAGKMGLNREIRWVHILEIPNIEISIRGGELILSTGFGLKSQNYSHSYYLERMIENGVACLCLELGDYFKFVPQEMVDTANKHNFPLIVFNKTVRFVDITQDLHSLIINSHYLRLEKLDFLSREFHRLTLTSQSTTKILKLLHDNTKSNVVYVPIRGNQIFVPNVNEKLKSDILESINLQKNFRNNNSPNYWRNLGLNYLSETVGALGQVWGYLILITQNKEFEEVDSLILDRAVTALSQDLLRKKYMDVRRLHEENLWIDDLISNKITSQKQVKELFASKLKHLDNYPYRVCLIDMLSTKNPNTSSPEESETTYLDVSVVIRTAFQKFSFHPFFMAKGNQLVTLLFDLNSRKQEKERYLNIIHHIKEINEDNKVGIPLLKFGIGRSYDNILNVHLSYKEATKVLKIKHLQNNLDTHFYEELGVYRLLINIENESVLQAFVNDYLGPLIEYDRTRGSELLRTLKVYFELEGSKVHTIKKLHIVRQTLYHRLEKIKELLGEDFMSSEKRLSIEISIKLYQWLYPDSL
ncbi:PucR family transcriptional regulator [Aneurinibacillus tyrosinisolvens]|uniref:PucR family transcriptional regulator n=1 Tax=Aneurinibacillus tyrosinisolvens TaxID=1443435 RepID=UPI00063FBD7A|nr:PucR family transcriptional regulator [Aneurinibacillus tyrosinisolvens]